MLLYDVSYYTKDGKRLADCDSAVGDHYIEGASKSYPNEYLACRCLNGDRSASYWMLAGEVVQPPAFAK